MIKFTTFLCLFLVGVNYVFSQNVDEQGAKSKAVPSEYNRNALTIIVLDDGGEYVGDLKQGSSGIEVSSKFDDNLLTTRYFPAKSDKTSIQNGLESEKIPNEILAKWFSRKDDGQFDMTVIHDRGMYNATDDEVIKASASKIGLAKLKDAGVSLINHSYILVLRFKNIEDIQKKYDKMDAAKKAIADKAGTKYEPVKRIKNGWEGDVTGYLYKLSFNDSIINIFYNDLWIYEDDDAATKAEKKAKFDQIQFPVKYVTELNGKADGTQFNPGQILAPPVQLTRPELFIKMINTGLDAVIFDAERKIEDFRVKTPVYSVDPIGAKIGKKESLKVDQRYFVLEYQMNRKGETVTKRKGVVRAKHIIDNRKVATGQSTDVSTFYQIAGHSIDPGMLMQQRNDFGLGISGGTAITGEMGGAYIKAEINVTQLAGRFAGLDLGITQLKLFGAAGFESKEYDAFDLGTKYDMSFSRLEVGLSKGYYFARNFSFAPFVSYAMESGTNEDMATLYLGDKGQSIGTDLLNFGAYATMNLRYNIQIMGTLNYYSILGNIYDKDRKPITGYEETKYTDVFANRKGLNIELGLRIEL